MDRDPSDPKIVFKLVVSTRVTHQKEGQTEGVTESILGILGIQKVDTNFFGKLGVFAPKTTFWLYFQHLVC